MALAQETNERGLMDFVLEKAKEIQYTKMVKHRENNKRESRNHNNLESIKLIQEVWDHKVHFRDLFTKSHEHDSMRMKGSLQFNRKDRGDAYDYGDNLNTDNAYI